MDMKRIESSKCHLPEELCGEILSRLPVKSLVRFCCVSKTWLSLIKCPDFSRLHLQNFKNNHDETHLLVVQGSLRGCVVRRSDTFETNSETLLTLGNPNGDVRRWRISCSVDGLFLLKSWERRGINNSRFIERLRIWNPSIRKFHDIPSLPVIGTSDDVSDNEEDEIEPDDIGFGYDPLMKDYKYIKLVRESCNQPLLVAVYTLGAASWKIIPCQGKDGCNFVWDFELARDTVYLRGNIYFIATHYESQVSEMVSFDVSSEVFSSVSLPGECSSECNPFDCFALVSNGCSSLVLFRKWHRLMMWVLECESMCWTEHDSGIIEQPECIYFKKNLEILKYCFEEEVMCTRTDRTIFNLCWVQSYNIETKEEEILLMEEDGLASEVHEVYGYMESLFLLK